MSKYACIDLNISKYDRIKMACVPSCGEAWFTSASGKTLETTAFDSDRSVRKGTSAELEKG